MTMQTKQRILLVEDEEAIRQGLIDVFIYHGYEVDFAVDGGEGLQKSLSGEFDLILLDVMLPTLDGFSICNQIREKNREQAIIMLTAKSSDDDIIEGLTLGADDYIAKPFSVTQLLLRVQAVLRRTSTQLESNQQITLADNVLIDCQNMSATTPNGVLTFTRREMDILLYLNAHSQRPVSRDDLLHKVWGYADGIDLETRTVDIHIAKLRRKLEPDSSQPRYVVTVRGAGYRLMTAPA
jgi:two-component system response regulator RegX3